MAILKTIVFQLFQCDCIDLWNTTGHTGDPDVVMNRIVCDPADMGFISKNNFFYKFMGLFIDDVDDRVMRIGMTVSSDQKVIFGNGKSLRSHGSTYRLFCTLWKYRWKKYFFLRKPVFL